MKKENLTYDEAMKLAQEGEIVCRKNWVTKFVAYFPESEFRFKHLDSKLLPKGVSEFYKTGKQFRERTAEAKVIQEVGGVRAIIPQSPDIPKEYWGKLIYCRRFSWTEKLDKLTFKPFLGLRDREGNIYPGWIPTTEDVLAKDWKVKVDSL